MENIILPRTGNRELAFNGKVLAKASSYTANGFGNSRWHELALYTTAGGSLVVAIHYRTRFDQEMSIDWAGTAANDAEATHLFRSHDPMNGVKGFPLGEHYSGRQALLEADMRLRYDAAVSELLKALGPETIE